MLDTIHKNMLLPCTISEMQQIVESHKFFFYSIYVFGTQLQ